MEAHALTVRLTHPVSNIIMKYADDVFLRNVRFLILCGFFLQVSFPFLVLLISGGHCLLAFAKVVFNKENLYQHD